MKILHTADWHLRQYVHGYLDPKTGANTRLMEMQAAVRSWLGDLVYELGIDLIVHAGDVGHDRLLGGPELALASFIGKDAPCPTVGILGNHDLEWHPSRPAAVSVLTGAYGVPAYNHIYHEPTGEKLCIILVPYPHRAAIAASGANVADSVAAIVANLKAEAGQHDKCIVVAHMSVAGAKYHPDQNPLLMTGQDVMVPYTALLQDGVDAVMLGHIHGRQDVFNDRVHYCGSLMRLTFGEEDDASKGVTVWDTETWEKQHIPNPWSPTFLTIRDLSSDWQSQLDALGAKTNPVYVRVKVDHAVDSATKAEVTRICEMNSVRLCGIVERPERKVRAGSDKVAEATTDEDVLNAFSEANGYTPETREALLGVMKEVDDEC